MLVAAPSVAPVAPAPAVVPATPTPAVVPAEGSEVIASVGETASDASEEEELVATGVLDALEELVVGSALLVVELAVELAAELAEGSDFEVVVETSEDAEVVVVEFLEEVGVCDAVEEVGVVEEVEDVGVVTRRSRPMFAVVLVGVVLLRTISVER